MLVFNASIETFKNAMIGKKVAVIGLGVSNIPAIDFLDRCGAVITACDRTDEDKMDGGVLKKLKSTCDALYLGDDYLDHLDGQDIILKSPGIIPVPPQILQAQKNGAVLTSEMEIFMSLCPCTMVGITGSDGKTTTTTLIYEILKHAGYNCHIGGNIGTPLIGKLEEIDSDDMVILELSSFQLMNMQVSPQIAVITNITPNHLNWHTGMEEYTRAKYNVFGSGTELLVLNAKSPAAAAAADADPDFHGAVTFFSAHTSSYDETVPEAHRDNACAVFLRGDSIVFSDGRYEEELLRREDIKLPGLHNVENYMTAAALTRGLAEKEDLRHIARTFGGVPHRIELVRELDGVKYYNSSIDSTPTRTEAALSVFDCRPVFILCGRDKHLPFDGLARALYDRAGGVVVSGEAMPVIRAALEAEAARRGGSTLPVVYEDDFFAAVDRARELARPGSAVVLSPSCTSFDRFRNFEERGNAFREYVNRLK